MFLNHSPSLSKISQRIILFPLGMLTVSGTLAGSAKLSSTIKYSNASLILSSIMGTKAAKFLVLPTGKVTLIGLVRKSNLPGSKSV